MQKLLIVFVIINTKKSSCPESGVISVEVSSARHTSRFTPVFENQIAN